MLPVSLIPLIKLMLLIKRVLLIKLTTGRMRRKSFLMQDLPA